jgi:hypothetical protein
VSVRVEAKDNDTVMGPKWGTSEVITLLPPEVGEPEALRVEALRRLRDVVVDSLAKRMDVAIPESADERKALLRDEALGVEADESKLESTITETHAGVRLAPRLSAMLRAAMRKVKDALGAEQKNFSVVTHEGLVRASERMVLVTDAVLRGLGVKDAREAARQLVDAADDLALGASQAQRPKEKDRSSARMDAATAVLEGGGRSLRRLGALGRDLGEIVAADLERVGRARFGATYQRGQEIPKGDGGITLEALDADWMHAELAARDLAARLRKPDPSFGARGGSSGRGGSEAGGGSGGASDEDDEMDDAERAFNEAAQEVSRLAQDHAAQMGNVDNALNRGQSDEDRQQFAKEAKERAEAVRQAVRSLPSLGEGSDSWTSKGATAKEHADSMARSLDNGNAQEAAASGRNALNDLEEAKRLAARGRSSAFGGRPDSDASRRITEAQKALEPQVAWAEQSLESLRKRAAERSASELRELAAQEEGLADRAHELMEKGRNEGTLPAPAADALEGAESRAREAGKSLKRGEAEQASEQQREAQRMLEMAREAMGTAEGDRRGGDDDSANADAHADIPKADAHRGPEEFRRRVVRGLGQPGTGRLKESIRRYAEGLLK